MIIFPIPSSYDHDVINLVVMSFLAQQMVSLNKTKVINLSEHKRYNALFNSTNNTIIKKTIT